MPSRLGAPPLLQVPSLRHQIQGCLLTRAAAWIALCLAQSVPLCRRPNNLPQVGEILVDFSRAEKTSRELPRLCHCAATQPLAGAKASG